MRPPPWEGTRLSLFSSPFSRGPAPHPRGSGQRPFAAYPRAAPVFHDALPAPRSCTSIRISPGGPKKRSFARPPT